MHSTHITPRVGAHKLPICLRIPRPRPRIARAGSLRFSGLWSTIIIVSDVVLSSSIIQLSPTFVQRFTCTVGTDRISTLDGRQLQYAATAV